MSSQISKHFNEIQKKIAAKGFRVELKLGEYDAILAGRHCLQPLAFDLKSDPQVQQRNSILVECRSEKPWKLFLNFDISLYAPVVVSSHALARNKVLSAQDLLLHEQVVNKSRYPHFGTPNEIIGMTTKQSLRAGVTLTPNQLKSPTLISRGDRVVISAGNTAVNVKMDGVALSEGRIGEQINVRNSRSDKVVRGVVMDRGVVSITL